MNTVKVTKSINVSAQDAWSTLSSFRGIENFSPIARSVVEGEGVGAKRSCFMPDNAEIKEELSVLNNASKHLQYKILSGPFPITGYVSDVYVKDLGNNSCEVTWQCEYKMNDNLPSDEMTATFEGFYNIMIDGLETLINSKN